MRKAINTDVKSIYAIVDSYAKKGEMLPCAVYEIHERLRDFFVYIDDETGEITGVCALRICWGGIGEIRSLAVKEEFKKRGIGKAMIHACLDEAAALGLPKVFALTYVPGFFLKFGFEVIDKKSLPHKIWGDCVKCSKFPECDETAVMLEM